MYPDGSTKPQETRQRFDVVVKFNLAVLVIYVCTLWNCGLLYFSENVCLRLSSTLLFIDMLDAEERDSDLRVV